MTIACPIQAAHVSKLQYAAILAWHDHEADISSWKSAQQILGREYEAEEQLIHEIVIINAFQWHEEDKSRRQGASDAFLGQIKKSIDASNQRRVNKIEELDHWISAWLTHANIQPDEDVPMNSETPASLIDRLSILRLKIFHMREETTRADAATEHVRQCQDKLELLLQQERDMDYCLVELIEGLASGKKRHQMYYQLKMYNDPSMNPEIYRQV